MVLCTLRRILMSIDSLVLIAQHGFKRFNLLSIHKNSPHFTKSYAVWHCGIFTNVDWKFPIRFISIPGCILPSTRPQPQLQLGDPHFLSPSHRHLQAWLFIIEMYPIPTVIDFIGFEEYLFYQLYHFSAIAIFNITLELFWKEGILVRINMLLFLLFLQCLYPSYKESEIYSKDSHTCCIIFILPLIVLHGVYCKAVAYYTLYAFFYNIWTLSTVKLWMKPFYIFPWDK